MAVKYFLAGFIISCFLLVSMYDVYFNDSLFVRVNRSHKLNQTITKAPFKRAVFITGDGLRGDIFFCYPDHHPFLNHVMKQAGSFYGITTVTGPTESLPAHMSMLAGVESDPSRVLDCLGLQPEVPPKPDTMLTQATSSVAIGYKGTVSSFREDPRIFPNKIWIEMKRDDADEATLEQLAGLIRRKQLPSADPVLIFINFNHLDVVADSFVGSSLEYRQAIQVLDTVVSQVDSYLRQYYGDDDTLFILTADHGLSESRHHGGKSMEETITPFVVWGRHLNTSEDAYAFQVRQVDWTPFLAAMLGTNFPSNSIGRFVHGLWVDKAFAFEALHANYLQLRELMLAKRTRLEENHLGWIIRSGEEQLASNFYKAALGAGSHRLAIELLDKGIDATLEGIAYYEVYDMRVLQIFVLLTALFWLLILGLFIEKNVDFRVFSPRMFLISGPLGVTFGLTFGLPVYRLVYPFTAFHMGITLLTGIRGKLAGILGSNLKFYIIAGVLMAVGVSIQESPYLGAGVVLIACMAAYRELQNLPGRLFLVSSVLIGVFPWLPTVGCRDPAPVQDNIYFRALGALCTLGTSFFLLQSDTNCFKQWQRRILLLQAFYLIILLLSSLLPVLLLTNVLAWGAIVLLCTLPVLLSTAEPPWLCASIYLATSGPFQLTSISYDSIFYPALLLLLQSWRTLSAQLGNNGLDPCLHDGALHMTTTVLIFFATTRLYHVGKYQAILTQFFGVSTSFDVPIVLVSKIIGPLTLAVIFHLILTSRRGRGQKSTSLLGIILLGQGISTWSFFTVRHSGAANLTMDSIVNHTFMCTAPWALAAIDILVYFLQNRKYSQTLIVAILMYVPLLVLFFYFLAKI